MARFDHRFPKRAQVDPAARCRDQDSQQRSRSTCFDRGRPTGINTAQHDDDQPGDGEGFYGDLGPGHKIALFNRRSTDEARRETPHEPDRQNVGCGQQKAGNDTSQEHLTDGLLGHEGKDDQHGGRRNDHPQNRAAGDNVDREARVVVMA